MLDRRQLLKGGLGGLAAGTTVFSSSYAAQESSAYPLRYITLVVPWGAGGPPDTIARVVAAGMSEVLGQTVVVSNLPGASTSIAATSVARAKPDGYTIMQVDLSFVVTPHLFANIGVNPLTDFKPIGQSATSRFVLVVSSSTGAKSVADFVRLAKSKRDAVTIGHSGVGTTPHLAAITFANAAGIDPLLVPYRKISDAADDVMAGHISAVFSAESMGVGLSKAQNVRVLGITGEKRSLQLPDVPTFSESGIKMTGFEDGSWYGLVAPAKTPDTVIAKLNSAVSRLIASGTLKDRLEKVGVEVRPSTPGEFATMLSDQYAYWGKTLRGMGISKLKK